MIETPQERVSRWLKNPLVDLADTEIREAIRAVLAQPSVAICREERDKGNGGCGACALCCKEQREAKEKAEAERDALREKLGEKGRVFSENLLMQGEEITRLRAEVGRLKTLTVSLANDVGYEYKERAEQAEEALGAYARLLVRAGVLRGNSGIGGQTMTGWACAVCRRDQVSPSTAHGVLCDGCRAEVIARAALPAPAQPCEWCDPSFGCFDGGEPCRKVALRDTAPAEEKRSYAPTDAIGDARVEAVEEGP